jgi:hypothetical protein
VLSSLLRDGAETNGSKVVDCESSVFRVIEWEDVGEGVLHVGCLEALDELGESHGLEHLLHDNLDENTT